MTRVGDPADLVAALRPGDDLIVAMAAGEPAAALDALEANHEQLSDVRVHQMHALRDRPSIQGELAPHVRHVSYFMSPPQRRAYLAGGCDLVACDFSAVPRLLRRTTNLAYLLVTVSPPDAGGWCSLGTNGEYVAALAAEMPVFAEINPRMPRTAGPNRVRFADLAGAYEHDAPLLTVEPPTPSEVDRKIAQLIAERIPDGATLQFGIGKLPSAIAGALHGHRDLGIHSELIGDSVLELIESGAVTGARKGLHPGVAIGTFALGSERLYRWLDGRRDVELHRVDWVNDPRTIAREPIMVSVNATTEVDLYGQCASETIGGRYWSGSGGQADFALGAAWSPAGQAFVALRATTHAGASRIRATLTPGSVVTTGKNLIDHVVTEHGVADLRGRSVKQRAEALIAVAAPEHRDALRREARAIGMLS